MSELVPGYDPLPEDDDDTPDRWSDAQKSLYSRLIVAILDNPKMFRHPQEPAVVAEHWETTARNVAWIAAEMLDPEAGDLEFRDDETDEPVGYIIMTKRTLS